MEYQLLKVFDGMKMNRDLLDWFMSTYGVNNDSYNSYSISNDCMRTEKNDELDAFLISKGALPGEHVLIEISW